MNRAKTLVLPSLVAVLVLSCAARAADPSGTASGHWEGSITLQGKELPIVVDLERGADGAWKGEIDIPSQGIRNLALDAVASDAATVSFHMPGIPGDPTFQGTIAENGSAVAGDLSQSGQRFPFRMSRKGAATLGAAPADGPAFADKGVPGKGIEGAWQGVLVSGPVKLRLIVKVTKSREGALVGAMDSVDQGAKDLPIEALTFEGNVLKFKMPAIAGAYEGTLSADGSKITGTWTQAGGSAPLELLRSGR